MLSRPPRHLHLTSFRSRLKTAVMAGAAAWFGAQLASAAAVAETVFQREIEPILDQYCYDCHGYGSSKGGVSLDEFKTDRGLLDEKLWLRALKNVRSGIMPPPDEAQPTTGEREAIAQWIKHHVFAGDPAQPDPGRITVRRLNRAEYRNTIRDLIGVDFDAQEEFPADDTGHGFDNIADVLTISPMLLEKYLDAAQAIIRRAVPTQSKVVAEEKIVGRTFTITAQKPPDEEPPTPKFTLSRRNQEDIDSADLSYYWPGQATTTHRITHAGEYQIVLNLRAIESYVDNQFDLNKCRVRFEVDGETLLDREFVREGDRRFEFTFDRTWKPGDHTLTFHIEPLTPDAEKIRRLRLRINSVVVRGPLSAEHWVPPERYDEFFPGGVPAEPAARAAYARDLLARFATKAFRRPVDALTVDRLLDLALRTAEAPGNTLEAGVAQAMVAVLASPRFLFREEALEPLRPGEKYPLIDEFALASRLSYFFWSSMPDDELFNLAAAGKLRANFDAQVERLFNDARAENFVSNFTGQWLQARDIGGVTINSVAVFLRENPDPEFVAARELFQELQRIPEEERTEEHRTAMRNARSAFIRVLRAPRPDLDEELRDSMRAETEMVFDYVLREGRNAIELIDSDYSFLNEPLAKHYGIEGVTGPEMRRVTLPPDSPRGGVLTQGTVLAVTSNPTRTSPVKRGVFILDNILGTPPPPPPPNIPPLENVSGDAGHELPLRESLALHASNPMCRSCHNRMDPLGLALENFNALGVWRDSELKQPIDPTGTLITGQSFADIRELKRILAVEHREDFFHTLADKMLTYALGRGLEYYDTETLDQLVAQLEAADGRLSTLITGIVNSAPFQRSRVTPMENTGVVAPAADVADTSSSAPQLPPAPSS